MRPGHRLRGGLVIGDIALPAFEMDCRDWMVVMPADYGLAEELAGAPLVAMLSTAMIGDDEMRSVSGILTLGLLDDDQPAANSAGVVASMIVDPDCDDRIVRYLLPAPDRQLALLAEFRLDAIPDAESARRITALMASFRWAA
jgi:hypothetical protein